MDTGSDSLMAKKRESIDNTRKKNKNAYVNYICILHMSIHMSIQHQKLTLIRHGAIANHFFGVFSSIFRIPVNELKAIQ